MAFSKKWSNIEYKLPNNMPNQIQILKINDFARGIYLRERLRTPSEMLGRVWAALLRHVQKRHGADRDSFPFLKKQRSPFSLIAGFFLKL